MKDPRLIDLRLKCERDKKVTDGAFRLFSRLVSDRYMDSHWRAEDEFTLPASLAQAWTGLTDTDTIYARIKNLVDGGYVRLGALRGCPATRRYFLCLSTRENPVTGTREKPVTSTGKKPVASTRENPAPHISNPFRKELSQRESNGAAAAAKKEGKDESASLRSDKERAAEARRAAELLAALKRSTL